MGSRGPSGWSESAKPVFYTLVLWSGEWVTASQAELRGSGPYGSPRSRTAMSSGSRLKTPEVRERLCTSETIMIRKNFMPGPTQVRPEILAEMARPPISHRGPEVKRLMAEIVPRLENLFGVRPDSGHKVVLSTSSSTAMMEAAVVSTVPRGGRVLNLICGAFSERWREITQCHGREAVPLRVEWG